MAETVTKAIEVTLGDGSVVKGADMDEAFKNLAKMKEDTANALREAKEEAARARQEAELSRQQVHSLEARIPKPVKDDGKLNKEEYYRLLNDDPIAAANYMDAHRFNTPDPVAYFQNTVSQVTALNQQAVAAAFMAEHSKEYPFGNDAAAKAIREKTEQLMAEGYPLNLRTMNMAWQDAIAEGRFKPADQSKNDETQKPPPNLSGAGAGAEVESEVEKFENMSTAQMEAELRKRGAFR